MEAWARAVLDPRRPAPGDGRWLTIAAFESDAARVAALEARGYRSTRHFAPDYRFDLRGEIPAPALPAGMHVRDLADTDADLAERVATHRDSWVGSSWSLARYGEIREGAVYGAELDLVVDVGDGTFANCCICWADPLSGVGSFEPVGTRPAWRGKGVTRALIFEGLRRLKAKGMHTARVGTAGFNAPAQALYEGCGFERTGTVRTFMRDLD
jgi:ribosomal protein S18 acetylase RimI-like enzyme